MQYSYFLLFEWTPSLRKEVGIPLGILPQFWERPNNATSLELEQVNRITAAAGNRTQRLARHQAPTRIRQIGIQSASQLSDEALGTKKSLK